MLFLKFWVKKFAIRNRKFLSSILIVLPEKVQYKILNFYRNLTYKKPEEKDKTEIIVNMIGFPTGDFGLGQHTRNVAYGVIKSEINFGIWDVCEKLDIKKSNSDKSIQNYIKDISDYNINIMCCNPDVINEVEYKFPHMLQKKYNVLYGAWELNKYPKIWLHESIDEYWAISRFVYDAISMRSKVPCVYMPYAIEYPKPIYQREYFNLPNSKFLFLFSFDMSSVMKRKNPQAVLKAFDIAFSKKEDVFLVIKVNRHHDFAKHYEDLQQLASQDKRILLIDKVLSRVEMISLINCCNSYISLHRSEGFGLGIAESMKLKKPVIVTAYSGNMDFTLQDNSCLVDYQIEEVNQMDYVFWEKGQVWANPSPEHAAYYMQKIYQDSDFAQEIGNKASNFIHNKFNSEVTSQKYKERLLSIL